MEEQRQNPGGNRRRRSKGARRNNGKVNVPVLIAARRPDSPLLQRHANAAASARPNLGATAEPGMDGTSNGSETSNEPRVGAVSNGPVRRSARIVQASTAEVDDRERLRRRLLERLAVSEGRHAISKVVNELRECDFTVPREQALQLQLLEHEDESLVRSGIQTLSELIQNEPPLKRPVLEQRLRRLEEYADEPATRDAARLLRRQIRG